MQPFRKPFRAEAFLRGESTSDADPGAQQRHSELMSEFAKLRGLIKPAAEISSDTVDLFRKEMAEAAKLKVELDSIHEAIQRTKLEIATLHGSSFESANMVRVSGELDAIVVGTESATESILAAAEQIDDRALQLHARAKNDGDRVLASEIQEKVVGIFEACNFQDLTGQRITKVVSTLSFVEDRINRMIEIWGGIEQFRDITPDLPAPPEGDKALLNGPALDGDAGRASQDDIDALFD